MKSVDQRESSTSAVATVPLGWVIVGVLRSMALVLGFVLLIALSAQVRFVVPGTDVPMTLQLLAVLMTGYMLAPSAALATLVLYLASGCAGLPVFAGIGGLMGPTGGYLIGFLVAAWLVSVLKGNDNAGWARLFGAGLAGVTVVLLLGVCWRFVAAKSLGLSDVGVTTVVMASVIPFLLKAILEVGIVVALVRSVRSMRSRSTGGAQGSTG